MWALKKISSWHRNALHFSCYIFEILTRGKLSKFKSLLLVTWIGCQLLVRISKGCLSCWKFNTAVRTVNVVLLWQHKISNRSVASYVMTANQLYISLLYIFVIFRVCVAKSEGLATQFLCTRFRNHVISIVISWFQQISWLLPRFQISTLTALRTAWFLFTVMISRQISDFNINFWFQYRFLSDSYRFLTDIASYSDTHWHMYSYCR